MFKKYSASLVDRTLVAQDTFELLFQTHDSMPYLAGQFVNIKVNREINDGRGSLRAFSLASAPHEKLLRVWFRLPKKCSAYKRFLTKCPLGTQVSITGPLGKFTLQDLPGTHVMIAGGVGIAPFVSYLLDTFKHNRPTKLKLLYTDKSVERMTYLKQLRSLDKKHSNFQFFHRFHRVDAEYIKEHSNPVKDKYYICGTPGLVAGVKKTLKSLGVSDDRIFFEKFSGY